MWIFACGPVRSGSTLQFNIVRELLEKTDKGYSTEYVVPEDFINIYDKVNDDNKIKLFKTHKITPFMEKLILENKAQCICCYRDIRDVITSKIHAQKLEYKPDTNFYSFSKDYVNYISFIKGLPKSYLSKYEEFYKDIYEETSKIADFLNIKISENEIKDIQEKLTYSKMSNKDRNTDKFVNPKGVEYLIDKKTLLHDNHFKNIHPEGYKSLLTKKSQISIEKGSFKWMLNNGYKIELSHLLKISLFKIKESLT